MWTYMCTLLCIISVCLHSLPAGAVSNGDRTVMNDGAFDVYLKQVESMHTQGKASFEAEFEVSVSFLLHAYIIHQCFLPYLA